MKQTIHRDIKYGCRLVNWISTLTELWSLALDGLVSLSEVGLEVLTKGISCV